MPEINTEFTPRYHYRDLSGQRFGRLLVDRLYGVRVFKPMVGAYCWLCKCDCGKEKVAVGVNLTTGKTKSCGCLSRELSLKRSTTHGHTRGGCSPEFIAWCSMIARCYDEKNISYHNYGGRGIAVCDRWRQSFADFLSDVGLKPSPRHSLDRVRNEENYEPGNVKWSTKREQCLNTRKTVWAVYRGEKRPLRLICEEIGVRFDTVRKRMNRGMTAQEAIDAGPRKYKKPRHSAWVK